MLSDAGMCEVYCLFTVAIFGLCVDTLFACTSCFHTIATLAVAKKGSSNYLFAYWRMKEDVEAKERTNSHAEVFFSDEAMTITIN